MFISDCYSYACAFSDWLQLTPQWLPFSRIYSQSLRCMRSLTTEVLKNGGQIQTLNTTFLFTSTPVEYNPRRNESRLSAPSSNNHHGRGVQHHNNAERCFKCGLTNHKTYQCRHKKQLQCYICKFYGHKDSVCWNF